MGKKGAHILKKPFYNFIPDRFIFFDTETTFDVKKRIDFQGLLLGYALYWDRITDTLEYHYFETTESFWNFVFDHFDQDLTIFAHNLDFDSKIVALYEEMFIKRKFIPNFMHIENGQYILNLKESNEKDAKQINFLDTYNYFPTALKNLGKRLNLPKLKIDLTTAKKEEIKIYCKRDTEIVYLTIRNLIEWLEKYELGGLKPTAASLAMNVFKTRFYDPKTVPIYIHSWLMAEKLERASYHGGITDNFFVGHTNTRIKSVDFNSMYPKQMRDYSFPQRLIYYNNFLNEKQPKLFEIFDQNINKKERGIIAEVLIELPEKYSYILTPSMIKHGNKPWEKKSLFLAGKFPISLCSPELQFVSKFGKILEIRHISIYQMKPLFTEFIEFFTRQKINADKTGDQTGRAFSKLIMNSLYGKFGARKRRTVFRKRKRTDHTVINVINPPGFFQSTGLKPEDIPTSTYVLGDTTMEVFITNDNCDDSFVAVASFITSHARMDLIKMIMKAKRHNVYYCDTDSLYINDDGFRRLKPYVHKYELGKLKYEGYSKKSFFGKPKYYYWKRKWKRKGIPKNAKLIAKTKTEEIFESISFEKFKTAYKHNRLDTQKTEKTIKRCSLIYDKGLVVKNRVVHYTVNIS